MEQSTGASTVATVDELFGLQSLHFGGDDEESEGENGYLGGNKDVGSGLDDELEDFQLPAVEL